MSAITVTGQVTVTGQIQFVSGSFSAPSKAVILSPADTSTHVALAGPITYANGGGATSYKVYLDASATPITPTTLVQNSAATTYTPSLTYSLKYWCRVDAVNAAGTTTGDIFSFTAVVPYSVDFFLGFEGLSVGTPTGAQLASARTTSIASGSWVNPSLTSRAAGDIAIDTNQMNAYTPADVDGTDLPGTGTRALVFAQELDSVYIQQNLPTGNWSQVDISGNITIGGIGGSGVSLDMINLSNSAGGYFVFQTNASFKAQAHGDYPGGSQTSASTSSPDNTAINPDGGTLTITADTVYQFRMNALKGGICTLKIYDSAGTSLLKTLKIDLTTTDKIAYWSSIRFGRTDAHGTATVSNMRFDNIRMILSTTTTPEVVSGP